MKLKKLILRKESFGGIFIDTQSVTKIFLNTEEYELNKLVLLKKQAEGRYVTFFDATQKGYSLLEDAASSPLSIFWELTKKCNCLCSQCFMDSNSIKWSDQELSFKEGADIVKQFSDNGGFYIRLTGGEPTIREDFFDIVDLINKESLVIGLNTNGLFDENKLDKILSKGIKDIRISLDGTKEINDKVRGAGTYKRIINTVKSISEYNKTSNPAQLTINVVLMKSNLDCVEDMIRLALNYNSKISFGLLRFGGRAKKEEILTPSEIIIAADNVQKTRTKLNIKKTDARIDFDIFCEKQISGKYAPFPFDNSKCPIGSSGFDLDASGRIIPCGYLVDVDNGRWIGENVKNKDLLYLWHNSSILGKVRKIRRGSCKSCQYHIVSCNGGCPVMAYVFDGDIDGDDPYCVRNVNISEIINDI